jgi:dihydropteroate synthase
MFTLNCNGKLLLIDGPLVMGIVNVTPDSFYPGSRFTGEDQIISGVEKMIREGVDIVDVGGQSTRPGASSLSIDQEMERVIKVIETLHKYFPGLIVSVDTYHSIIAANAVAAGASVINDISGGVFDDAMLSTVGRLHVPYICVHIKGTPLTMQQQPAYENVTREVLDFFIERIEACRRAGITDVILDPGFGFGKTSRHNFDLLKNLSVFKLLEKPLLIGVSRKSTISKTLGVTAEEALNGTTVLHTVALMNGANMLRVHDVREAKEAVRLTQKLNS